MLTFKVEGVSITPIKLEPFVSGTIGMPVKFIFDEEWAGKTKLAVYDYRDKFQRDKDRHEDKDIEGNTLEYEGTVSDYCIAFAGEIRIGVCGFNEAGRKVTVYTPYIPIMQGAVPEGIDPPAPQDIIERIIAALRTKVKGVFVNGESVVDSEMNAHITLPGKSPYTSLRRIATYLYEITFEDIPEIADAVITPSACTSFVRDGQLHRNLDWYYDESPSFKVIGKGFEGTAIDSRLLITEGFNDDVLGQLPYHIVDGKNDNGIMMSVHVLYNDWEWSADGEIPLTALPFYVLQNVKSMATIQSDLADVLGNLKVSGQGDYLIQILVTDGTTTYVIAPPESASGSYVLIDATENPKLTNFRWINKASIQRNDADLQSRPTGVERWNGIAEFETLDELRFTLAYEAPARLSEFIGIAGTTKDSTDAELEGIYSDAHEEYLVRERDGKLWQTVHSVVYSANRLEHLWIQEDWHKDFCLSSYLV